MRNCWGVVIDTVCSARSARRAVSDSVRATPLVRGSHASVAITSRTRPVTSRLIGCLRTLATVADPVEDLEASVAVFDEHRAPGSPHNCGALMASL